MAVIIGFPKVLKPAISAPESAVALVKQAEAAVKRVEIATVQELKQLLSKNHPKNSADTKFYFVQGNLLENFLKGKRKLRIPANLDIESDSVGSKLDLFVGVNSVFKAPNAAFGEAENHGSLLLNKLKYLCSRGNSNSKIKIVETSSEANGNSIQDIEEVGIDLLGSGHAVQNVRLVGRTAAAREDAKQILGHVKSDLSAQDRAHQNAFKVDGLVYCFSPYAKQSCSSIEDKIVRC